MLFSDFIPEDKNEVFGYFLRKLIKVHLVKLESLDHQFPLLFLHGCSIFPKSSLNTHILIWKI